ncbi:MAG TPA: hypothetical protein VGE41_01175 [Verrucomicrobiae bacterium]
MISIQAVKRTPPTDTTATERFTVASEHAIDFADAEMPAVLSTPKLVGILERTARLALAPFLSPGETSVGTEIELQHFAPSPLGETVTCLARVVRSEAPEVWFSLEVRDSQEIIAKGFHKRRVIEISRFARRVSRKRAGAGQT